MSTRPHLDDPQIAVRYLSDKLSSTEREAFEEHYLKHPKVVEEMELDAKLKAGLISIRNSNELDRLRAVTKRSWVMPIAIAAAVLIAASLLLAFRYLVPDTLLATSTAALRRPLSTQPKVAATYKLLPTRAGLYDAVIALPKSPQAIRLQVIMDIEPPIPQFEVVLAAVSDDGLKQQRVSLHHVRADDRGFVTLYLNSAAVGPGTYELSVSGEGARAAADASTFTLKVIP